METNEEKPTRVTELKDIDKLFEEADASSDLRKTSYSYEIVGLMMYLTGVEKRHFEHIPKPYDAYGQNGTAHIIRNLCILRTSFIRHFQDITRGLVYDMESLSTMPEYIPPEAAPELADAGIAFNTTGKIDLNNFIIKINQELSNRINQIQPLFPEWIKWDYIKALFIMPGGSNKDRVKEAAAFYNSNRRRYPYQIWINWDRDDCGNIFYNDQKFISLLYEANGDTFEDKSLIRGTKSEMLDDLYGFIEKHEKVLIVVDCENSDPVKLAAALLSLNGSQMSSIGRIMLIDSANTTPAWETLCGAGITRQFDTEHKIVTTLYENKSQVDMQLAIDVTKAVCLNGVDAVILVSSDSDYWTMIRNLPETDFLVMLEKMKSGSVIRDALEQKGYRYCFIDDFCTAKAYSIKTDTILNSIQKQLDEAVSFNLKEMLEREAKTSWLSLTGKEADNLFNRYLRTMRLKVQPDGAVRLIVKE